jgi:hypothetical protein
MGKLTHDIYVDTHMIPEDFANDLAANLDVAFVKVTGNEVDFVTNPEFHFYIKYSSEDDPIWLRIGRNVFANDDEEALYTKGYPYQIEVGSRANANHEKLSGVAARQIFEKLKATQRYSLVLQYLSDEPALDTFEPGKDKLSDAS